MLYKASTTADKLIELCKKLKVPLNFIGFKNKIPKKLTRGGYIINEHNSTDKQTTNTINHWVGFYTDTDRPKEGGTIFYFDSYAYKCQDTIINLAHRNNLNVIYNTTDYQSLNSGGCGYYTVYFLHLCQKNKIRTYSLMDKEFKDLAS